MQGFFTYKFVTWKCLQPQLKPFNIKIFHLRPLLTVHTCNIFISVWDLTRELNPSALSASLSRLVTFPSLISMNIHGPHILPKNWTKCHVQSPTAQGAFRPIPGLISCTGVSGETGSAMSCKECSQVAGFIQKSVEVLSLSFVHAIVSIRIFWIGKIVLECLLLQLKLLIYERQIK